MWRYSPIDELSLDDFSPAASEPEGSPGGDAQAQPGLDVLESVRTALGHTSASVLVHGGRPAASTWAGAGNGDAAALAFGPAGGVGASADMLGSVQQGGDALVRLNDAFMSDPVFVDVAAGATIDAPVLVVHWCEPGAAAFPRTCVRAGEGATVSVVEVFAGPASAARTLVVPVTELSAAAGASVSYVSLQILSESAWSIARLSARGRRELLGPHLHRGARRRLRQDPDRRHGRRS